MAEKIRTNVINGNLQRNRNLIVNVIRSFEGKEIELSFSRPKKERSNKQNSHYWGFVLPIVQTGLMDATGELRSVENIHYRILLPMFAPEAEISNKHTGEIITEKLSSSEMSTIQFMAYMQEIQKWGAEFLGIDIPDPNEKILLNL
jgi:hypothetical protein